MRLLHRARTPSPKPKKNSNVSNETKPNKKKFMKLFKKQQKEKTDKKTIKCEECFTIHCDIDKNKYCYNCGHCLYTQNIHKQKKMNKEKDKILKKDLVSFTAKRFHLVSEYHNKCKIMDQNMIEFVEEKINIEQQYIENNKVLITKFNQQNINTNKYEFTSTLKQIILNYVEAINQTIKEHEKYLLFLKETEKYLQKEHETMLDFMNEFKEEHNEKLQNIWLKWKDIDSHKMNDTENKSKKKDLWKEWQIFLKNTLKSFPIFIKMRYKKNVYKVLSNMIINQINIYDKTHCNYLNIFRIIHETTNQHSEIESFMEYHKNVAVDSLESLIQSLGFETEHQTDIKNDNNNNNNYGEILHRTRCNGIEWFSPLIFSEKGIKTWNLNDSEWNIIMFEQILCETFESFFNRNEKWDKAINCIRHQFEISKKKMNELMNILMINDNDTKYRLSSLCHRIEVIQNIDLIQHFNGDKEEYKKFIHRQLSFTLSCIIWYILESQPTFWNVSGSKQNKSDLIQSLHSNMKLVQNFCEEKVNTNNEMNTAFSPINNLMLMIQEIANGINDENIPIPNAIYQKIYIEIMNHCFVEKENDILSELDLSSTSSDHQMNDKRVKLYDEWTQIADLLFSLSTKTFMISVNFHCFAFLEFIFDKIIAVNDDDNMNPLIMIKPDDNKKDFILLKIIEETFIILMDDVCDDKRLEMNKYQENMYTDKVIQKIENKLVKYCSDYKHCSSYTISKFFLFFIFINKIKNKDIHFVCYDKLIEFTLITATQISNQLKDKYSSLNMDNIKNLNKFRIDFLHILHDQIKWHSNLDKYLKENIDKINTVQINDKDDDEENLKFIVINDFNNNHTETFLLQWMTQFSNLVNDKLQHLKHQDIDKDFLSLIHEINEFILITNQYKDKISIENKKQWHEVLPPLKKICVFKFKQWVKNEFEPIFKRCIDSVINNEKWNTQKKKKNERRRSSLMLYQMQRSHTLMSDAINKQLAAKSAEPTTNTQYISDNIIDLCSLTDSMTNGCLSFLISLKLYNFSDSKSYFKVIQKELMRVSDWISKDINQQISMLLPPIPILSRNIINIDAFQNNKPKNKLLNLLKEKTDDAANIFSKNDELRKQQRIEKEKQETKLMKLAIQMHSLDFILSSLNNTKQSIEDKYKQFIEKELKHDASKYLEKEIEITLHNENVSQFLFGHFEFISLKYDENGNEKEGLIISLIKNQFIEYKYDLCIGFQLINIGDKSCKNELFDDIIDLIKTDYDDVFDKLTLKFKFNLKGVINALFVAIYDNYNKKLKQIASLISCEIMYNSLYDDLFNKLYHIPLDENRFSDLNITNKLFKICDPIFEFLNDKNFKLIIHDIFNNLRYCICYILTQTKDVSTKVWIKNDYGLIKDDIDYIIKSFQDDVDEEYIANRCIRIYNILEMIKFSTEHLTQHNLPLLQNINPKCANNHILHECIVEPHKMLNYNKKDDDDTSDTEEEDVLINCTKCKLFINIKYKLNDIGYYFCGNEMCLKQNLFYCGKCCNKLMYKQNVKSNISKWDLVSMLNKKKDNLNDNHSKQYAIKYAQNQCIRSQITMTFQQKSESKKKSSIQQTKDSDLL